MVKILTAPDYNKIVLKALSHQRKDYFKYYLNIIEEHYKYNQDIIKELILAVNSWCDWYKSKLDYKSEIIHFDGGRRLS